MFQSDPRFGWEATVTLRADGVACAEYPPQTSADGARGCSIGVRTGQELSIDFFLTGACREVFVDIIVDGVFRRVKHYVRDGTQVETPLKDIIHSVWCRRKGGSKLYWSPLDVANIDDFRRDSGGHCSTNPGNIEVQISIADGSGTSRQRRGRTFEDDVSGHLRAPIDVEEKKRRGLTHMISIGGEIELSKDLQRVARNSNQLHRPGKIPWARFSFQYRQFHALIPGNLLTTVPHVSNVPGNPLTTIPHVANVPGNLLTKIPHVSNVPLNQRAIAAPPPSGPSMRRLHKPASHSVSFPRTRKRTKSTHGSAGTANANLQPVGGQAAASFSPSLQVTSITADAFVARRDFPGRPSPSLQITSMTADAFLAREFPHLRLWSPAKQNEGVNEARMAGGNGVVVRLPINDSGRMTSTIKVEDLSDAEEAEEAALRKQEEVLKELKEAKEAKKKMEQEAATCRAEEERKERKANRKRRWDEMETEIQSLRAETEEPQQKRTRGQSLPAGIFLEKNRVEWDSTGKLISSLKTELAELESKRARCGKELGFL